MSQTLIPGSSSQIGGASKRTSLHVGSPAVSPQRWLAHGRAVVAQAAWWPEAIAAIVAFGGLVLGILPGFHPLIWQTPASDFKTLYASAALFRQHADPYSFATIATVFNANHVVQPASWYAHAPVYPPFTLAMIAPLTLLSMEHAIYLTLIISALALALAAFSLARASGEIFLLSRPWRLALIGLFAAFPLLSFGFQMINVSMLVGALSILAVVVPQREIRGLSLNSVAIVLALLLKPHLALWVVVALLISRSHRDRKLALQAVALSAIACILIAGWMAVHHQLLPQLASYRNIVHQETSAGSMSPANHELIDIPGQITSLSSLLGYAITGWPLAALTIAGLLSAFATLCFISITSSGSASQAARLNRIAAWSAFGMLATYHRAHDAAFLVLVLPYVLARLRMNWRDPFAWAFLLFTTATGLGPRWDQYQLLATKPMLWHLSNFLLYRQTPLVIALLFLILTVDLARFKPPGVPALEGELDPVVGPLRLSIQ